MVSSEQMIPILSLIANSFFLCMLIWAYISDQHLHVVAMRCERTRNLVT